MTLESDVAAIASRTLWLRARDLAAADGSTITHWIDYDGVVLAQSHEAANAPGLVTTSVVPPAGGKAVQLAPAGTGSTATGFVSAMSGAQAGIAEVIASSSYAGLPAGGVFDGYDSEWASNNTAAATIGAKLKAATVLTGYKVMGRQGAALGQAPKNWTFEGSQDGSSWTVLDTQVNQNPSTLTTYTFANSTAYLYYRMNISIPQSGTYVGLRHLYFTGTGTKTLHSGTSGEIWAVIKAVPGGERSGWVKAGNGTTPYYPYTDGVVYYEFGSAFRQQYTPTGSGVVGNWHVIRFVKKASGLLQAHYWTPATGWVQQHSSDTGAAQWASVLWLGKGGGTAEAPSQAYVTEVVGFGAELSSGDITTVTNYLNAQHFTVSSGVTVAAPVLAEAFAVPAPTVSVAPSGVTVAAPALSMGVALPAPTVPAVTPVTVAAPVLSVAVAAKTPTVSAATNVTVAAPVLGVAVSVPAPDVLAAATGVTVDAPVLSLTAELLAPVVESDVTSLDPWTDGAHGEALLFLDVPAGVLEVTYPATAPPAAIVEVSLQRASHQMPALTGVRAMDYDIVTDVVGVPHVWVDGVDVTYFRDHPTRIAAPKQETPFVWTSTVLTFPQVFHWEEPGVGDLAWMRPDAPVEIALVRPDGTRIHRFTGQLTSDEPSVGQGRTECVLQCEGILWQADHARHPVPARLDPTDIGTLIPSELNGTPSRRFSAIKRVTTGIPERKRGSLQQTRWEYVTDLLAASVREDGGQWTIEPTGPRSFRMALKDTTTVHWTVTAGAPGVFPDLKRDQHERIDAVYGYGVGPDGYAWRNVFFPDLLPYDPPDYPYSNPAQNVVLGSTDAGTLTGHGISDWQRRIRDLGYTSLAVDGVMNSADIAAVRWIQRKRGIQVDGFLGPQTWAATWNVGAIGGDLSTVRLPMAVRPEVEPYIYAANGAVIGENPAYDPSIIRHEVDIDFGHCTKAEGMALAQRILERGMDPGIAGTVRLETCPWEGSRHEINAGDNILVKGYRGSDVLARIVAVDPDWQDPKAPVTLTIDSEFREAMAVIQVLERKRESKADPARRPGNPNKRSRLDQDMVTPFEGESPAGRIPRMALYGGLWTVWPVPVSEIGEVARLRFRTSGPAAKFCLAMFGKPITANQLDAIVPAPLTDSAPWQDREEYLLDTFGWIDTWGKAGQASGYSPGQEGDGPLTGKLTDDAGFPYVSQKAPWVWVAMWSPVSTFIEGRIYPSPVQ